LKIFFKLTKFMGFVMY